MSRYGNNARGINKMIADDKAEAHAERMMSPAERNTLNMADLTFAALAGSRVSPAMPATPQQAVVTLQHIINLFPSEPDVIFTAAMAIADVATEACENGTIVDPLAGSDFNPEDPYNLIAGGFCTAHEGESPAEEPIVKPAPVRKLDENQWHWTGDETGKWAPLMSLLGKRACLDFMYMGECGDLALYKHINTRRYLNIDRKTLQTYQHTAGVIPSGYEPIPVDQAIRYMLS